MCGGCLLQTLRCLSALSWLETARAGTWTHKAFPIGLMGYLCVVYAVWLYWLFSWAHLKQTQRICRVWLSGNQISGERYCMFHTWTLFLPRVIHNAYNDPLNLELFLLLILPTAHMILLPQIKTNQYKDNVREVQQFSCEGVHCITLHSISSFLSALIWCFSISFHLPPHQIQNNDKAAMQAEWNTGDGRRAGPELLDIRGRWG